MSKELVRRQIPEWIITMDGQRGNLCLTVEGKEIKGSFQDLENYMFENGLLSREEFKQKVWTNGFLSTPVGELLQIGSDNT